MKNYKKNTIRNAVKDILWMARRYADMRQTYAPDMFNDAYDVLRKEFGDDVDPINATDENGRPVHDIHIKSSHEHPYAIDGGGHEFNRTLKARPFYPDPMLKKGLSVPEGEK